MDRKGGGPFDQRPKSGKGRRLALSCFDEKRGGDRKIASFIVPDK